MNVGQRIALGAIALLTIIGSVWGLIGPQFFLGDKKKEEGPHPTAVSIGFVDVQKVFQNSNRGKEQIASFQGDLKKKTDQVKHLSNKVESMRQNLQYLLQRGDKESVQKQLPAFQALQKKLNDAQQSATTQLQKQQSDVDKAFMEQLRIVMEQLRKEEHLDIIQAYDPSKTLSFDSTLDMTQKALAKYNQTYPSDTGEDTPTSEHVTSKKSSSSRD